MRQKKSLYSFFIISAILISCSSELEFNSFNMIGRYEGNFVFQRVTNLDTVLIFPCIYSFDEDGKAIYESINGQFKDTMSWYIQESSEQIILQTKGIFSSSRNRVLLFNQDSLIFQGERFANINGSSTSYLRTLYLERK